MKRTLLSLTLSLMMLFLIASPVLAIADPDTVPSVNAVYVYEFDDGSVGVLVDYYLDYAVLPSETATAAYLAVFYDTVSATQFKAVAPYTFVDSGYGRGLVWIPFTAAEVTALGIASVNITDYEIWLTGNPTLAWAGDPPKTVAAIDQWNSTGDMSVLLALRVTYYADVLELAWSLDMVEATSIGNRLTATGESYFENVILGLRVLAPNAFASSTSDPGYTPISYVTTFGATATSGTATIVGSPFTLVEGTNTIDTGVTVGTIILDLADWTYGTIDDDAGTIANTPIDLTPGVNTLTVTGAGTFTVVVAPVTSATLYDASVTGTGLDMTGLGTIFGMSRWMISGLVWMAITVLICVATYSRSKKADTFADAGGATKVTVLLFTISTVGGTLLGLLHPLVSAMLFILCGAFIGYVLFFRSESLHKGFMFMAWMFIVVSFAGNFAAGSQPIVATYLTADVSDSEIATIHVASTDGFPDSGIIVIADEQIGYPTTTAITFSESAVGPLTINPLVREMNSTTAADHLSGAMVRTREASFLNAAIDYKIARIADNAGVIDYITLPGRLLDLVITFFVLPLDFLGTDLAVLSYVWMIVAAGMIVGFVTAVVGGRRV